MTVTASLFAVTATTTPQPLKVPRNAIEYFSNPELPLCFGYSDQMGRHLTARNGWVVGDVVYSDEPYACKCGLFVCHAPKLILHR